MIRSVGVLLLAAGCSASGASGSTGSTGVVSPLKPGTYLGTAAVDEHLFASGIPFDNQSNPVQHRIGIDTGCDDGQPRLIYEQGCVVPIVWGADGNGTLAADYPCAFTSNRGLEDHRILGGTLTHQVDGGQGIYAIDLQLRMQLDMGARFPKGGGTGTWHAVVPDVTDQYRGHDASVCEAAPLPAGEKDYSALAACAPADFDASPADDGGVHEVHFGPDQGVGLSVVPRCLIVARGERVRWVGDFPSFPLGAGVPGTLDLGEGPSPLPSSASQPAGHLGFPFDFTGDFVFHLGNLAQMEGVVRVK